MDSKTTEVSMFMLTLFAEFGGAQAYTNDCDTATNISNLISQQLLPPLNNLTQANWSVVWGPAIFSFPINYNGQYTDNVIYVVQNGTTSDYAIAIAGTNGASVADWLFEDFIAFATVPWAWDRSANISGSTALTLGILLNIAPPCSNLPGSGKQLVNYLGMITGGGPINLYVTGHSLGGAMSPTLALALAELAGQNNSWDPKRAATILPYSFAGPTPGDGGFVARFKAKIPAGLQRIWNSLDGVPQAWDKKDLANLPTLYSKVAVQEVSDAVNAIVGDKDWPSYTPLNDQPSFTGTQQNPSVKTMPDYLIEEGWQHVNGYLTHYGLPPIQSSK